MSEDSPPGPTPSLGDPPSPVTLAQETRAVLDEMEARLLSLVREAAHGARPLEEVINLLDGFCEEVRPRYQSVQEYLGRRDLTFETSTMLETLSRRTLWLYRKCRLEHIFFQKLHIERRLRDALHRQVLEAWHEISSLDDDERSVRAVSDDALARELLIGEAGPPAAG